jgi:hypothetical protein
MCVGGAVAARHSKGSFANLSKGSFASLRKGNSWLLALVLLQIVAEHFVWSFESTWATDTPWASEWLDYYRY